MPLIEALSVGGVLNLMGHAANALGIYSEIGGIYTGRQLSRIAAQVEGLQAHMERLNDHILYADIQEVYDVASTSQRIEYLSDIESLLSSLQRGLERQSA